MTDKQADDALLGNYRKVTGHAYDAADYRSGDETSQGTAVTHEQLSDAYFSGTSDGKQQLEDREVNLSELEFDEDTQE